MYAVEERRSFTIERNIVLRDSGVLLQGPWTKVNVEMDRNCYWNVAAGTFDFAGLSWEQWPAAGHDSHSIIADPGFFDTARRDFRLREDSPVRAIGLQPFDFATAGVYDTPRS